MNFPSDFIASIRSLLGEETASFLHALSENASVSVRVNPLKGESVPMGHAIPMAPVPWSRWGYYLEERPAFTFDPLLHAGYYYVQEASSMFIEHVVESLVKERAVCLDLCAAPGGKSLSLLSALPEGSLLVSNELVRQRAHVLSESVAKFGYSNVMVTNNMANDFSAFPHFFDLVLVDAPCSGEGMFRKDETAVSEWSPQNVEMCAARQRDILTDIWSALKPGGLMIYSTCTYNMAENEENALWIASTLGAEFVPIAVGEGWGISSSLDPAVAGARFFPHKSRGEGLFVTVLRKLTDGEEDITTKRSSSKNKKKTSPFIKDRAPYADLLDGSDSFRFMEWGSRVVALPVDYADDLLRLEEQLKTVSMGIELGEKKGKDFIPSHSLVMSNWYNANVFPSYEVTYEEAIAYLRRESLVLENAPRGYLILTYKGVRLGFVKNIGNRANNMYPNEWRIRSGYMPDKTTDVFVPKAVSEENSSD